MSGRPTTRWSATSARAPRKAARRRARSRSRSGKFKFNGKIKWFSPKKQKNVPAKLLFEGKFSSATKFKGSYQITVDGCKTPKAKYTAKLR